MLSISLSILLELKASMLHFNDRFFCIFRFYLVQSFLSSLILCSSMYIICLWSLLSIIFDDLVFTVDFQISFQLLYSLCNFLLVYHFNIKIIDIYFGNSSYLSSKTYSFFQNTFEYVASITPNNSKSKFFILFSLSFYFIKQEKFVLF